MFFIDKIIKWLFGTKNDTDPSQPVSILSFTLKKYPKNEDSYVYYEIMFDPITIKVYITPDITSAKLQEIIDETNSLIRLEVENGKDVYDNRIICFIEDKFYELMETTPIFKDKGLKIIYDDYIEEE